MCILLTQEELHISEVITLPPSNALLGRRHLTQCFTRTNSLDTSTVHCVTLVQGTLIFVNCSCDTLLLSLLISPRLSGDAGQGKEESDSSTFHFLFSIGVSQVYLENGMYGPT